jgi:hypothetical protein
VWAGRGQLTLVSNQSHTTIVLPRIIDFPVSGLVSVYLTIYFYNFYNVLDIHSIMQMNHTPVTANHSVWFARHVVGVSDS